MMIPRQRRVIFLLAALFGLLQACDAAGPIPPFTRIALMGDSISQLNGDGTTYLKRGLWTNLSSALHQQVDLVYDGSAPAFATSGYRAKDVQTVHLPKVLASNAEACIVLAGTNDGDTVESVAATLNEICKSLADHGITPILCDVLPIAPGIPARSAWLISMKGAIKGLCDADPRFIHLDWFNVLDTDNDGVIDDISYFVDDGQKVHPDGDGMSRLGAYAATVLAPYIRPRDFFDDIAWISPNPTMTGAGSTPDQWAFDLPSGASASQALIARGNGLGNWWQIGISGPSPTDSTYVRYGFGFPGSGWAPGDAVELVVEFETDDNLSPTWDLRPILFTYHPNPVSRIDADTAGSSTTNLLRAPSGVLRTPPFILPADTNGFFIDLQVIGTGTFRLGRVGVRKAPLTFQAWITGFPGLADMTPDGDPDHDGLTNRMEWILGGNPSIPDAPSLATVGSSGAFSFHQTPRSLVDCGLQFQTSGDLQNWTATPLQDGAPGVNRDPADPSHWIASPAGPSLYYRLSPSWK